MSEQQKLPKPIAPGDTRNGHADYPPGVTALPPPRRPSLLRRIASRITLWQVLASAVVAVFLAGGWWSDMATDSEVKEQIQEIKDLVLRHDTWARQERAALHTRVDEVVQQERDDIREIRAAVEKIKSDTSRATEDLAELKGRLLGKGK